MNTRFATFLLAISLLPAWAQYTVTSPVISAVNVASSADGFSVSGNISQPVVGKSWADAYSIENGSVLLITVITVGPDVSLSLTTTNTLLFRWTYPTDGFQLEEGAAPDQGVWTKTQGQPVQTGEEWEVVLPVPAGNRFYRLGRTLP